MLEDLLKTPTQIRQDFFQSLFNFKADVCSYFKFYPNKDLKNYENRFLFNLKRCFGSWSIQYFDIILHFVPRFKIPTES